LTEKDKIIANADPIEIPAVVAFPFALICSPSLWPGWIFGSEGHFAIHPYGKYQEGPTRTGTGQFPCSRDFERNREVTPTIARVR
jgi:hypothetical protein